MMTCSVEGCEYPSRALGWCLPHWGRNRRYGSPTGTPVKVASETRFWAKVNKSETCWNWTGGKTTAGYGMFARGGRGGGQAMAHRYSWEMANGPIPEGMVIDHTCHNPSCVNPDHLRVATYKQNNENKSSAAVRSSTGVRGVIWDKVTRNYRASVTHNYRQIHVGRFSTLEAAEAAVTAKRLELFTHNDADRSAA